MGRFAASALLLKRGADTNAQGKDGITPVYDAMEADHAQQVLPLLLVHGVKVNKEMDSATMLHCAAERGYVKKLNMLLTNGADIECKDNDGFTTLHCTTAKNWKETIWILK